MPRLALVVPCFNEQQRLEPEAFLRYLRARPDSTLVFVDDGSTDGTLEVLRDLEAAAGGAVSVLALERNVGKAEAVRRGVRVALAARPTYFGYWDADLSTPITEADAFVAAFEADSALLLVLGSRVKLLGRDIRRHALRHYLGRVFATFASLTLDLAVYDTQCGAKVLRTTPATRWLFRRPFLSRWLFDVEILARLGLYADRRAALDTAACVREHALPVWRDARGSKVKALDFLRAALDLGRIFVRYRCCTRRESGARTRRLTSSP